MLIREGTEVGSEVEDGTGHDGAGRAAVLDGGGLERLPHARTRAARPAGEDGRRAHRQGRNPAQRLKTNYYNITMTCF